jgi:hypothetical protein
MQWRFAQTDDSTVRKQEFVIDYSVVDSDMYCAPPPIYILRFGDPLEIFVTGFQPQFSR